MTIVDILRPTWLKLFFPILFFVLLIISLVVNLVYLPPLGDHVCSILTNADELGTFSEIHEKVIYQENSDPEEVISFLEQENEVKDQIISIRQQISAQLNTLILGNLYLTASKIYKLNPFFPSPCEAVKFEDFTNPTSCKYYISQESYTCIYNLTEKQDQTSFRLFLFDLPPYQQISTPIFLVHSVILVTIIYIIISFFSFIAIKLLEAPLLVRIIVKSLFIFVPMFLFLIFENYFILLFLPIIVIYFLYSFVQDEKHRKLLLIITLITFVLLLIAGLFFANYVVEKSVSTETSNQEIHYEKGLCQNTKILTSEEIQKRHIEEYLDEEWNVCDNPSCASLCDSYCNSKAKTAIQWVMLRGEDPSCICGCQSQNI